MVTNTRGVLTTTTEHIPGRVVREYMGIVGGEAVVAATALRTMRTRRVGCCLGSAALREARRRVLREMARRASERGATVVLGVAIDYVPIGVGNLLVAASGTAVRL